MTTVLGTNTYWPSATNSSTQPQKQEMSQTNTHGSVTSSNSSASSLAAFNFDDSGVGNEEHHQNTMIGINPNISPSFYLPPHQSEELQHFNNIYNHHSLHQYQQDENSIGNNNGPLFKDLDASKSDPMPICSCCQQPITDRFILRVHPNLEFHASCLKCSDCQRILDESCTVFLRNGHIYCKDDYARQFAKKCQRCDQQFALEEMVMRARNLAFHLDCFTCVTCNRRLGTGEQFVVNGNELYCQSVECFRSEVSIWDTPIKNRLSIDNDCHITPLALKAEPNDESTVLMASSSQIPPINYGNTSVAINQSSISSNSSASSISGRNSINVGASSGRKSKKDKPSQRVRTVLTEQQLKILKHMYTVNQRPDATTKETLVQQTGLSQRVIRVWFQNKRCKDKKKQNLVIEQEHIIEREQAINGVRMTGVGPIVALSPTCMQETGLMNPIDIRQFPQSTTLWSNACDAPSSNQSALAYSSMMNNIPPTSYPQEMSNVPSDYGTSTNLRYGPYSQSSMGLNMSLNGLPNSSLSSSPVGSD